MLKPLPTMPDDEVSRCTPPREAGFGSLMSERGPLPLKAMDVQVRIDGLVAQINLQQTFVNVHAVPLEATYIFPLPDRAAVTRFRLEVAGRVIEGQLKERGAARKEYRLAIVQGHRASIAEEERAGVFTLRVGNLPPGESARVQLSLTGPLPCSDGEATFRFPLVVAPRYVPGTPLPGPSVGDGTASDTDAVPDASRISPPVLLPGFPNPVQLKLHVDFGSALQPHDLRSSLHTLIEGPTFPIRRVSLQPGERLNRDFILRFRLAEDRIRTGLSLQPDAEGNEGTFLLTLVPPATEVGQAFQPDASVGQVRPRDVVFVLDRSGSMEGWKIVAARRALARMVETLTEQDRFSVIAFDNHFELPAAFAGRLVSGSDRHRFQAVEFLARIRAQGGTEMAEPLARAVDLLHSDPTSGRERVLVLVTDGQVGNEDQILQHLGARAKKVRIFTLGIDRAVNAAFLRRLSDLGGGASELVESEERLEEVMTRVHRLISPPLVTALKLEPAGLKVIPGSVVPGRLADLFAGTPLLIMGRYQGQSQGGLFLQGRDSAGSSWQCQIEASGEPSPAIASIWARGRLRELEDRYAIDSNNRQSLEREVVNLSLRHGVLCRFTSFVAVDRAEVVNPGGAMQGIVQPVEQVEGWAKTALAGAPSGLSLTAKPEAGRGKCKSQDRAGKTDEPFTRLIQQQIVSPEQLEEARSVASSQGQKLQDVLVKLGYATAEQTLSALAEFHGLEFVSLTQTNVPAAVVEMVPESVARENVILPLAHENGGLRIAISDPSDFGTVEKLTFILNKAIQPVLAIRDEIVEAINRHYGQSETESVDSMLAEFTDTAIDFTETEGGADVSEAGWEYLDNTQLVIGKLCNLILAEAIQLRASEIQIEPLADRVCIRYCINGILVERDSLPRRLLTPILSRLKIMGSMDITETHRPQEGRIKLYHNGKHCELHVSTLPTAEGQSCVIRILERQEELLDEHPTDSAEPGSREGFWK